MAVQSLAKIIADPKTPASAKVAAIGNMLKFSRESLGSTTWRRGSKRWRRRRRRMTATGRRRRRGRAHQRSARQAGDQDGATRPVQGMRRPELPADRDRHAGAARGGVRAQELPRLRAAAPPHPHRARCAPPRSRGRRYEHPGAVSRLEATVARRALGARDWTVNPAGTVRA
jgi:hypothetical protein